MRQHAKLISNVWCWIYNLVFPHAGGMEMACVLCDSPISRPGEGSFCCIGCEAVYNVLSQRGELAGYQQSPLFQQAVRSGLVSNPHLLERLRQTQALASGVRTQKLHLEITDLWCPSCAEVIRLVMLQHRGVVNCVVDYYTDLASVEFSPLACSKESIFAVISALGYHPVSLESSEARTVSRALWLRFLVASFGALNLMMFAYPLYAGYFSEDAQGYSQLFAWLSLPIAVPVVVYGAWPLYKRAWSSLRVGLLGMEALVVLGVSSAFVYSLYELVTGGTHVYFDSMAVIVAFVLLGKILETKAKFSAKASLLRLTHALPRRGRKRLSDGEELFVPLKDIRPGDHLVALMGEKIVLDGVVQEGEGAVDESLLTGESIPTVKKLGSSVITGTHLLQGRIVYCVTSTPEQTLLQQIIHMVEKDWGQKTFYVRLTDQIASWFVPVTLLLAVSAGVYVGLVAGAEEGKGLVETAVLRALAVLLISCPCAIGIAVPYAESNLMHGLAGLGAIVRNRRCLAYLGRETVFVFDKTGTITSGVFSLQSGAESLSSTHRAVLKGLTRHSIHPISCAIFRAMDGEGAELTAVEEVPGLGLRGEHRGSAYFLGSRAWLEKQGVMGLPDEKSDNLAAITSTVYFAERDALLAALLLGDAIRPDAFGIVQALTPCRCVLLSGDGPAPVEKVARACGFSEWLSGCSPMDKRSRVVGWVQQGETVAMLGDGINDTLAISAAHVGMSVVSAADLSIQVSDVLLTTDRLQVVANICALARKGRRIVRQNLFWAFAYNIVGVGLAVNGSLSPLFAAFAMSASSVMVLLNAQRVNARL